MIPPVRPLSRPAERRLFVPLFMTQVPNNTLTRLGMTTSTWFVLVKSLADIDLHAANDLNTFISLDMHRQILGFATRAYGHDQLLRWYVGDTEARHLGPVGVAAHTAPTVNEALAVFLRYVPLLAPAIRVEQHMDSEQVHFLFESIVDMDHVHEMYMELSMLVLRKCLLQISPPATDIHVAFHHTQAYSTAYYLDAFGVVPQFDASCNSLSFKHSTLALANPHAHAQTFRQALADCEVLAKNARHFGSLRQQVQQVIAEHIRHGEPCTLETVAHDTGLSIRTLTRRLKQEHVHFRDIQSEVRLDIARQQLYNTSLPLKDVAHNAGFASLASFSKAFSRLTGQTPTEYRHTLTAC